MKVLVLFSGTKSFEKILDEHYKNVEYRGLDIDNHFIPYYNVDILEWDYKKELSEWQPDYIHASPICCEFTVLKNRKNSQNEERNLTLGYSLLNRSWDIIQYVKNLNPKLLFTIENPVSPLFRQWAIDHKLILNKASYCMYGFPYGKNTYFLSDIPLKLCQCNRECSNFFKENKYHQVSFGYSKPQYPKQINSSQYCQWLRKQDSIDYKPVHIRYRIPPKLISSLLAEIIIS
jgi:site-specific DNA-cytosine methylase